MHDPLTVAFRLSFRSRPIITIWHKDPERRGSDDSCGWFMRAHHGDKAVLERIVKRFEFDWDRIYKSEGKGNIYFCGYFCPNGDPHFSVHAIVLNLFFVAIGVVLESNGATNWEKARAWMQRNLFDILIFAENPTDSLVDGITRKFEDGCGEPQTPSRREERIRRMASCIYGWILRERRPWYRHPRWHIWHWRLDIHLVATFKRWAFSRCCKCGKGFRWGYCPTTDNWNGTGPLWFRSENGVYHSNCEAPDSYNVEAGTKK